MACVLIIDDDQGIRELFADAMEEAGHTVYQAKNGLEGVKIAQEISPDVIVVDVFMPEMDGVEVILKLRKTEPDLRIIAVSGGGLSHNFQFLDLTNNLGANLVLHKPILPDELVEHVATCLKE